MISRQNDVHVVADDDYDDGNGEEGREKLFGKEKLSKNSLSILWMKFDINHNS